MPVVEGLILSVVLVVFYLVAFWRYGWPELRDELLPGKCRRCGQPRRLVPGYFLDDHWECGCAVATQ